jgi:hypothetical protein
MLKTTIAMLNAYFLVYYDDIMSKNDNHPRTTMGSATRIIALPGALDRAIAKPVFSIRSPAQEI